MCVCVCSAQTHIRHCTQCVLDITWGFHSNRASLQIAAGESHSACVTDTSAVLTWGSALWGQLGLGANTSPSLKPTPVLGIAECAHTLVCVVSCLSCRVCRVVLCRVVVCVCRVW